MSGRPSAAPNPPSTALDPLGAALDLYCPIRAEAQCLWKPCIRRRPRSR